MDAPEPDPQALFGGRFRAEQQVHVGGMAKVFRAVDTSADTVVALKRPARDDARELERFQQEGEILAELRHPGVVSHVAHGGTRFDDAFIATEWLEGGTLQDRLEQGPLGIAEAVALLRRAAEALGAAHRARVIHRDVKPANLMLCDGPSKIKLLDFGIARREQGSGLSTHTSFAGGTWAYMSPEQVMGAAELGPRTDVFSLGCVVYECLLGVPAFPAERSAAMVAKVWNDAPRLADHASNVPPALSALVAKLLARDPLARPHDGSAVASELAKLGGLPEGPLGRR
jgi:eukaryotic-like serine/threonine-protein kinase